MAIVLQVPLRAYSVGPQTLNPVLAGAHRQVVITFTRNTWPSGEALRVTLKYPDGTVIGSVSFGGSAVNRQGLAESSITIRSNTGPFLPEGQYTAEIDVIQALSTAVTVDIT